MNPIPYQYLQVPVTSWFDDPNDTELLDLIPFFEALDKVDDVVSILGQNRHLGGPELPNRQTPTRQDEEDL